MVLNFEIKNFLMSQHVKAKLFFFLVYSDVYYIFERVSGLYSNTFFQAFLLRIFC